VRIYDFKKDINSFCWGSWILNDNKTKYAALEAALLIYNFAFNELGFSQCHMDIRKNNEKVINFHKRFGVEIVGQTDLDLLGIYTKESYESMRSSIESIKSAYTE
jgi:RimJ/RimL family protein N-acetyltransferase